MALLLVYLVLAGQYESWFAPLAVILSVPLALVGPVLVLEGLRIDNNLYTQIGLMLLIALSAKNAILIVEVAREQRVTKAKPLLEAAVEAATRAVPPDPDDLVRLHPRRRAAGDRDRRRRQRPQVDRHHGVLSGMIASTCLAVLFVPSLFVVMQRFEEWRAARKTPRIRAGGITAVAERRHRAAMAVTGHSHNLDAGRTMVWTKFHHRKCRP